MPEYELQEATPRQLASDVALVTSGRAVLDQYHATMREFATADLADILMRLAAFTAYASELRGQIQRHDTRRLQAFRTKELDPFIDECDRQFKIWSRVQSVRQMEWDTSKGGI